MADEYIPVGWKDNPNHDTAVEAKNLNHMDDQIVKNATEISGIDYRCQTVEQMTQTTNQNVTTIMNQIGNLKFVILSRAAYNEMERHDPNTLYIFNA